jgi:RHS repeat-associated protein
VYNGLGDRLSQTVNGVTTQYTLDLNTSLTQVLADGTNTYLYGNGRVGEKQSAGFVYHLADALGSVRQVTDATSFITQSHSYEPFGKILSTTGTGNTSYGFVGEQTDATGLVFLRARYYGPQWARFLTRDPFPGLLTAPQTLNPYVYALNSPMVYTDPSGRFVNLILGTVIGAAIGAAIDYGGQVLSNINQYGFTREAFTRINWCDVGKAAVIGAVGGLTFGVGLALGTTGMYALGVSSATPILSSLFGAATVALSGVAAGQTSRLANNVLSGRAWHEGLGRMKDMGVDAALSITFFRLFGGRFNRLAPSDVRYRGAFAQESVPADPRNPNKYIRQMGTKAQQFLQWIGNVRGCQHCGTRVPGGPHNVWIGDHIPMISQGNPVELLPQCDACRNIQSQVARGVGNKSPLINHWQVWRLYKAWAPLWTLWENWEWNSAEEVQ